MILVRTGGMLGLTVAAAFLLLARHAIDDTADRPLDRPSRPTENYLSAKSFGPVVAEIKDRVGPHGELLALTVSRHAGGDVEYRAGDHAAGFRWGPGRPGLEPVKVTLVGPGRLADNVFPIARLEPRATAKLTAAAKARAGQSFEPQTMTLALDPATGIPTWTVTGDRRNRRGRTVHLKARFGANGLKRIG